MEPHRHIACCIDTSDAGAGVLAHAAALRARTGAKLTVVHVVPPLPMLADGLTDWEPDSTDPLKPPRRWLEQRAAEHEANAVLLAGPSPGRSVCDWLGEADVDLVVAATHNDRLTRAVFGSFARTLAYESPVDTLVIPPGDATGDGPTTSIGCCIDDGPGSAQALRAADRMRAAWDAPVTLVHVVSPPRLTPRRVVAESLPIPERRERAGRELLERAAAALPDAATELFAGPPEETTVTWARRTGVDMLVVGPRADGEPILGGFSERVAREAHCPVLLARDDGRTAAV